MNVNNASSGTDGPLTVQELGHHKLGHGVQLWTLNRPQRMNALSAGLVAELTQRAREMTPGPACRAVIVTGAGDRAFCAGADLKERAGMGRNQVIETLNTYRACLDAIDAMPVPVVAAIQGVALGGGLELALACDFRVARSTAVLALPEVTLGIIPGAGGTQRLTRLVGEARAKQWILRAEKHNAQDAFSSGVVDHVVDESEDLIVATLQWLAPMHRGAPLAVSAALQAIDAGGGVELSEGLDRERQAYLITLDTQDRLEALAAFQEKRPPKFRGE